MVTEKFRRQLRHESEQWWQEGLIDAALYEKLSDRYQFHRLEGDASHRFVAILMGLGGTLLGLAVITFVAANWQAWPREFKLLVLLSLFIGANSVGFYLWRSPRYQKLGQSLLLLGALILGANLSLMSQMFHQSGPFYQLLLVWGLGVLAMAYSLKLNALGILSLILVSTGYGLGWLDGEGSQRTLLHQAVLHMPLVTGILFIPLAHRCRSQSIFGVSAVLLAVSLTFNLRPLEGWINGGMVAPGLIAAMAFTLPPALLWSYHPHLWRFKRSFQPQASAQPNAFQAISRSIAIWFLSIVLWFFAFGWAWEVLPHPEAGAWMNLLAWASLLDAIVLAVVAGLGWLQLRHAHQPRSGKVVSNSMIGGILVLIAGLFYWHYAGEGIAAIATLAFNLMLFSLAIGLIRDGLALGSRQTFWGGMLSLVFGIICRMLEYDTGLLLKSVVFAICGLGIIAAGLWFERTLKPHHPRSPKSSLTS
jgi:uncharacterized membrane protein